MMMLKIKNIIKNIYTDLTFSKFPGKYILRFNNITKETFIALIFNKVAGKFMLNIKSTVKKEFIDYVADKISEPKVILEIGSRDAIQSIEFSRLFPKAKIYAFECCPLSVKTCIRNTKKYKNIEIVPYAVFNENKKMDFYISSLYIGASSLFEVSDDYKDLHKTNDEVVIFMKDFQKDSITVDAIRIDDWAKEKGIEKIDLVWIDLQGAEYEAFDGMGELLPKVQAIYSEVENTEIYKGQKLMTDVTKLLNEKGLSLLKYIPTESISEWGNAIYINNKLDNIMV